MALLAITVAVGFGVGFRPEAGSVEAEAKGEGEPESVEGGGDAAAATSVPPTIVHVVADDLGWDGLGFANGGRTHTPHVDAAVRQGVLLTSYYTYKVCSPSRASIMTGRYPWGVGYYDMKGQEAVPLEYQMLPELLRRHGGYETYAVGKWNLGALVKEHTPHG